LTFVSVVVNMVELALSTGLVKLPHTFIAGSILPGHSSLTMAHASLPGARILGSCLVLVSPVLLLLILSVDTFECLLVLFFEEVLGLSLN
jgi:hypothetical protein